MNGTVLQPLTEKELQEALADAARSGSSIAGIDLKAFGRLLEHAPADMTATVETGMSLGEFQERLRQRGQWLPIDPPFPSAMTIAELLMGNRSGPRRFGYGTVREYLLGMKVALGSGEIIRTGGKVVKNVAGYDLAKLFIGSKGTLGWVLEATFKLRPLPETEEIILMKFGNLNAAGTALERVLSSALEPVVVDLFNLTGAAGNEECTMALAFAGTREDVAYQVGEAKAWFGGEPGQLGYEEEFGRMTSAGAVHSVSVLPSRLIESLRSLGEVPWVARAGNGMIEYRGGPVPALPVNRVADLMARVKQAYDPKKVFPEIDL